MAPVALVRDPLHRGPASLAQTPTARIATITPSGNTVVERVTLAILADFPEVSPHFSRTPVHGDRDPFPQSYDFDSMLAAARLLAHALPNVIVWNGSKAGSIDFALDHALCSRITEQTGIAATTSILALDELLKSAGVVRIALVSPYDTAYQQKSVACFGRAGYECLSEAHSGLSDNLSFATVSTQEIATMLREVAKSKPAAIVTLCTNFLAAPVIPALEAELGIPIYDTTVLAIWKALKLCGIEPQRGRHWGRLFEL